MEQFNTDFEIKSIQRFVEANPNTGIATNAFKEALETAKINNRWMLKNKETLRKWLNENFRPEEISTIKPTTIKPVTTSSSTLVPVIDYRLPLDVIPIFYDLEIQAWIGPESEYGEKAFTQNGKMTMTIICNKATKRILFHAAKMTVETKEVKLTRESDGISLTIENLEYDQIREYFVVNLEKELGLGQNYSLYVPYSGQVLTEMYGFYQSSYEENGVTK